jgi:hypothetical protein
MAIRVEPVRIGAFEVLFGARTCRRQRAATLRTLEQHHMSVLLDNDFQESPPVKVMTVKASQSRKRAKTRELRDRFCFCAWFQADLARLCVNRK